MNYTTDCNCRTTKAGLDAIAEAEDAATAATMYDNLNSALSGWQSAAVSAASGFRNDQAMIFATAELAAKAAALEAQRADDAWYAAAQTGVRASYESEYYSDYATYMAADAAAYSALISTLEDAQREIEEEQCRLMGLLQDSVNTGVNTVIDGTSSLDVQVCFAAGTPIRLSNGEVIPVEEAKPGMKVRVPNENDPEGEHFECEIVEVYHNPPSLVTRLKIESESSGKQMTIRGTETHRFYVVGFGWKPIRDLEIGDRFLSENGEKTLVLIEKVLEPKPVPVYNFQVKGCHTYFVGETVEESVLVHNERCFKNPTGLEWCSISDGWCLTHWVAVGGGMGYASSGVVSGGNRYLIRKQRAGNPYKEGFTVDLNSNVTPYEHVANNTKPSPYSSASSKRYGSPNHTGTPYAIDVREFLKVEGNKIITTKELVAIIKNNIGEGVGKIHPERAATLLHNISMIEGEVLLYGNVPPEAVKPVYPNAKVEIVTKGVGKACFIVGAAQSSYNLGWAAGESIEKGSIAPIAAQGIREAGIWGGAWAGATTLGPLGLYTGPAAPVAVPIIGVIGGIGGGVVGWWFSDKVADNIYPN